MYYVNSILILNYFFKQKHFNKMMKETNPMKFTEIKKQTQQRLRIEEKNTWNSGLIIASELLI